MPTPTLEKFPLRMPYTSRPVLPSHQSNSLPSTPYIAARELPNECRTPSPIVKGSEMASPRSARSESDTGARPSGRTAFLAGCKFETGMAFSRRRIPYSLGGDRLERVTSGLKKQLDPNEEEKLSGDMRELYDRILPSVESEDRRTRFVEKLERILNGQWLGNSIKVHVFGSSGNLLCTTDSDVDICITTPMKALERVCLLAKALADHGMERVVCVPHAKVPIVKIWDPELELACDMNVNNTLALENTRMIKTYVQIDERVRPLAMVIKHWTRRRILNDAALGGTLSSYTWICLIINFLQTRSPPVLPCLHQRPHQQLVDADGKLSSFADDIDSLRGFGKANKESIGKLLFHFFRRYAHEIDFDKNVISVREGGLISKEVKMWHLMQNNRLCVEEPFNTERNLGNTADDISFRGVHLELRRAFDLLSQAKLEECCEQYVFPPIEEKFWSKPAPQPRPVLSRSLSQSGRAGRNGGASRGHSTSKHRAGTNRRASSAAASNNMNLKMNYLPGGGGSPNDRASGGQIHEQLMNTMNFLQAQEAQLRLQMHQRQQANIHAHITAQAHVQTHQVQGPGFPHHLNLDALVRQRNNYSGPMSAPLRNDHPIMTFTPSNNLIQISTFPQQSSAHTNPSSPSMSSAQIAQPEFRRSMHRSTTTDTNFSTLRSHSQPASDMRTHSQAARPLQVGSFQSNLQGSLLGYSTLQQYQQAYLQSQQMAEVQQANTVAAMSPRLGSMRADSRGEEPRQHRPEYVGYYVEQSPPTRTPTLTNLLPPIPAYRDLTHNTRGISPSLTRLMSHTSRSPSPSSLGSQDRSINFYTAASNQSASPPRRGSAVSANGRHSGPIIIDGSSETSTEYLTASSVYYPTTMSEAASISDDQPIDTPLTPSAPTPSHDLLDSFELDAVSESRLSRSVPNILQFGDFPVRSTRRDSPASIAVNQTAINAEVYPVPVPNDLATTGSSSGLGIELGDSLPTQLRDGDNRVSPPVVPTQTKVTPKLEMSSSHSIPDRLPALKPLPLLSPVREVRTPSPTANRNSASETISKASHTRSVSALSGKEFIASPLSVLANGKENLSIGDGREPRINGINGNHGNLNGGPSTAPKSPSADSRSTSTGWQQTGKKGKKSKNKGSISSMSEVTVGERKGG
ncbi:hypothetical protein MMC30_005311 [Trapelia coarctata]|nr:hypothetical protein [Trapelia coarctata]